MARKALADKSLAIMAYLERGYTHREAARAFGVSRQAIEYHVARFPPDMRRIGIIKDVGVRSEWTAAKEAKLRRLWIERPDLSAAMIGEKLGLSRNAVIGKAYRLELPIRQRKRVSVRRVGARSGAEKRPFAAERGA